jgi:hypothetical protein
MRVIWESLGPLCGSDAPGTVPGHRRPMREAAAANSLAGLEAMTLQGQRPLSGCSGKHLQQEVVIPAAGATFHDQAIFAGMLLEQGQ